MHRPAGADEPCLWCLKEQNACSSVKTLFLGCGLLCLECRKKLQEAKFHQKIEGKPVEVIYWWNQECSRLIHRILIHQDLKAGRMLLKEHRVLKRKLQNRAVWCVDFSLSDPGAAAIFDGIRLEPVVLNRYCASAENARSFLALSLKPLDSESVQKILNLADCQGLWILFQKQEEPGFGKKRSFRKIFSERIFPGSLF